MLILVTNGVTSIKETSAKGRINREGFREKGGGGNTNRPNLQLAFLSSAAVALLQKPKPLESIHFLKYMKEKPTEENNNNNKKQVECEHPTARDQIRWAEAWIFFLALSLTCNTTPAPFLPQGLCIHRNTLFSVQSKSNQCPDNHQQLSVPLAGHITKVIMVCSPITQHVPHLLKPCVLQCLSCGHCFHPSCSGGTECLRVDKPAVLPPVIKYNSKRNPASLYCMALNR